MQMREIFVAIPLLTMPLLSQDHFTTTSSADRRNSSKKHIFAGSTTLF